MVRVLLTGATGYLGSRLLEALTARGDDVRVLVRDRSRLPPSVTVDVVVGDLLEPSTWVPALEGVDAVIHVAALVKVWVPNPQLFHRVNVEATERLIRAAADAHVARILYTSSFIALGPSPPDKVLDETAEPRPPYYNAYHRSKAEALVRVRTLQREGYPVITLIPGVIYGPGPRTQGNFVAGMIADFLADRVPGYIGSGYQRWCFAWIGDVVQGFLRALDRAPVGREYILGGENRSLRDLFERVAAWTGRRPPRWSIPKWVLKPIAATQFAWDRLRGREPRVAPDAIDILALHWAFSSARAQRELGYTVMPFDEGLRTTVNWMLGRGGGKP